MMSPASQRGSRVSQSVFIAVCNQHKAVVAYTKPQKHSPKGKVFKHPNHSQDNTALKLFMWHIHIISVDCHKKIGVHV